MTPTELLTISQSDSAIVKAQSSWTITSSFSNNKFYASRNAFLPDVIRTCDKDLEEFRMDSFNFSDAVAPREIPGKDRTDDSGRYLVARLLLPLLPYEVHAYLLCSSYGHRGNNNCTVRRDSNLSPRCSGTKQPWSRHTLLTGATQFVQPREMGFSLPRQF